MYDVLFGADGKAIGLASKDLLPDEMADDLKDIPRDQIQRDTFRIIGGRFVKSVSGSPYTYWSKTGPIDIATIALLSTTAGSEAYFFKKGDQPMDAFLEIEDALDAGYAIEECVDQISLSTMIVLTSCNIQSNKYVVAINKYLQSYTSNE